jgi:hypothetical protein
VLMRGWVLFAETVSLDGLSHSMVEYVTALMMIWTSMDGRNLTYHIVTFR